jgi:glucosamine-6-phosphate deaminase
MKKLKRRGIEILIFENKTKAIIFASNLISNQIKKKLSSTLGLATGDTMKPLYKKLSSSKLDFSKITTFNLDTYLSKTKHPLITFMEINFFSKTNINISNTNFPTPLNMNSYDRKIKSSSGIDLQILGLGRNGHIAFNEPGSSFNSLTRKVKLSSQTKRVNKVSFKYAITMGIKSILNSKEIILLAFGKEKANAIANALAHPSNRTSPASALQLHKKVIFILDKSAASKIT